MTTPSLPTCAACVRRLSRLDLLRRTFVSPVQTRGKKTNAVKKTSIPVRLIQDLAGYGRKGSIVPMTIGPMRNVYFPRRIADYLTFPETKNLKREGILPERDFNFGKQLTSDGAEIKEVQARTITPLARATTASKPIHVTLDRMKPPEAFRALSRILPPSIVFYRTAISQPQPSNENALPNITPQPPTSAPDPFVGPAPAPAAPIYGSVTTSDIATSLRALVAASEMAGRVVLGEEDLRFTHVGLADDAQKEDASRVKRLGDFEIEISVKGHPEVIRREVKVLREEEAPVGVRGDGVDEVIRELAGENPIKGSVDPAVLAFEAETRQTGEVVDALMTEARTLMREGRIAKPEVTLTPAEEAEIQAREDARP